MITYYSTLFFQDLEYRDRLTSLGEKLYYISHGNQEMQSGADKTEGAAVDEEKDTNCSANDDQLTSTMSTASDDKVIEQEGENVDSERTEVKGASNDNVKEVDVPENK